MLETGAESSALDVTLKKGVNVVVLEVANNKNNWQRNLCCLDPSGKPVTDVEVWTAR